MQLLYALVQLLLGQREGVGAVLVLLLGLLQGLLGLLQLLLGGIGSLQLLVQLFGGLLGLPVLCFQRLRRGFGGGGAGRQNFPALLPLRQLLLSGLQLGVPLCLLGVDGGQLGADRFTLALYGIALGFCLLQGLLCGGDIQRRIARNGRVFLRAAQRAGFAGLQRMAVLLQTLDALLL